VADEAVELADDADLDEAEAWEAWGSSTPGGPTLGGGLGGGLGGVLVEGGAAVVLPSEASCSPLAIAPPQSTLAAGAEVEAAPSGAEVARGDNQRPRSSLALAAQEAAAALARQGAREEAVLARCAVEEEARRRRGGGGAEEDARLKQATAANVGSPS